MRGAFKFIIRDTGIKYMSIFFLILLVVQLGLIGFFYPNLPPVIPFLNSLSWGEGRLTPPFVLFFIPLSVFCMYVLNMYAAVKMYKKHQLMARIVFVNIFVITFLSLIAAIQILLLIY